MNEKKFWLGRRNRSKEERWKKVVERFVAAQKDFNGRSRLNKEPVKMAQIYDLLQRYRKQLHLTGLSKLIIIIIIT